MDETRLYAFIAESNAIEGIHSVSESDIAAHRKLLALESITVPDVESFVIAITGIFHPLRDSAGMNVTVGKYEPPKGGDIVRATLGGLLFEILGMSPYVAHQRYEQLHPFMDGNGRSGRALWAWHMNKEGRDPFALPFLHRWYYESLNNWRG
jgi:hypothetical protein